MNNLQIFKGHKVEIIEFENKILFNPYDVGKCLELEKTTVRRAIQGMNENQVIKLTNSAVQNMNTRKLNNFGENFLTESGVYKLIFKSNKPKAEEFANWVTDEVLPSIRQTGSYGTQNSDIVQMLVVSQKNMMDMISSLTQSMALLSKTLPTGSTNNTPVNTSNHIQNNTEIQELINNQKYKLTSKLLTLPQELLKIVDILLSQEDRNFSYISRYLKSKGYDVSFAAVSRYYHKYFKGVK